MVNELNKRLRYSGLISLVLVGAGGIISNLLPLVARLGSKQLVIWDDDKVGVENLPTQGFGPGEVGEYKSNCLAYQAQKLNPSIEVSAYTRRLHASDSLDGIVISGVDSMESRRQIFDAVMKNRDRVPLYLDGRLNRLAPKFFELYVVDPNDVQVVEEYRSWLTDKDAAPLPRPTEIVAHVPYLLAGVVGEVLARWLQRGRLPWKVTFDAATLQAESYFME